MKASEPKRPSDTVIKRLFARSGNRCAYPKCTAEIVHGETIVGEVCHIKAASPNGPRYDPRLTAADRHNYDNLILLCGNHHTVVDDDPEAFTVERLSKMKLEHEQRGTTLSDDEIVHGTRLLIDKSVTAVNQSGGITAHTVHQTINVHPPGAQTGGHADRQSILARIRKFHRERVERIATGAAPVALLDNGILAIHVVPFDAVSARQVPSFDEIARRPNEFPPIMDSAARNSKIDYEGLLTASNAEGLSKPQRAYTFVFRSGAVEAVASSLAGGGRWQDLLVLPKIQATIIKYTYIYANALNSSGVEAPMAVLVSLLDVDSKKLLQDFIPNGARPEDLPCGVLSGSKPLQFGEAIFETAPTDFRECAKVLRRPILDHLANAAGLASSPYFDAAGNYALEL